MKNHNNRTRLWMLALTMAAAMPLIASCDTKACRCYVYDGQNPTYIVTNYVDEGVSCSTLDYNRSTQYRICTEMSDPEIDPGQIGREYKKETASYK